METRALTAPERLVSTGRIFYALATIGLGILHVVFGDFVTRMLPGWPAWVPGRSFCAFLVGAALIAAGLSILLERGARAAALLVAAMILLSLLVVHARLVAARPGFGGAWTNPFKYLAIGGGAILVAGLSAGNRGKGLGLAQVLLGIFLGLCGFQHFIYADFVATIVPAWIPEHFFWTYFAGIALIAGAAGLAIPRTARLAAFLSGVMIFLWFLSVHVPRALAAPSDPKEWSGVCESLAVSGIALMVAGTLPRRAPVAERAGIGSGTTAARA